MDGELKLKHVYIEDDSISFICPVNKDCVGGDKKVKRELLVFLFVSALVASGSLVLMSVRGDGGLVGYWSLNEGSGTTAGDGSGSNNNGTLNNGPVWVSGKYGTALSFDGVGDYVEITENTDLDPHTNNWTISAWVNIAELSDGIYGGDYPESYGFVIACKRQTEYDNSLTLLAHLGTSKNSQAEFAFVWDGSDQAGGATSSLMNVFGWHYVAGVRSGGQLYVYVDGLKFGPNNFGPSEKQITPTTDIDSSTPVHLSHHGAWGVYYNSYYNGTIDEVRIYDRALSQQEIRADMGISPVGGIVVPVDKLGILAPHIAFSSALLAVLTIVIALVKHPNPKTKK